MSRSDVTKHITKPLLKTLEKEARDVTRKDVQAQTGQLLILNDIKVFKKIIKESTGVIISNSAEKTAYAAAVSKASSLQKSFSSKKANKARFNTIVRRLPEVLPESKFVLGKTVFIVTNFTSSMSIIKDVIFDSLVTSGALTASQKEETKSLIHKGHGVRGNAVSQVGIAQGISRLGNLSGVDSQKALKVLDSNLESFFTKGKISLAQMNEIQKLTVKYNQMVTTRGKLKAQYFSIIDFQEGKENLGVDSQMEKALVKVFRQYIDYIAPKLADIKGSSSLVQKVEKQLVKSIAGKPSKRKRVKTPTGKYSAKSRGTSSVRQKKGGKPKITLTRSKRIKKAKFTRKGTASSPFELIAALNKALPATIRANMGSPKLNYRTGVFANSVKVTNIMVPPRGYPVIDYTYQQEPYGVFEVGNSRLASLDRDPRNIIDETIRELAVLAAFRKFHTRRVF